MNVTQNQVEEVMTGCALRFNGPKYEEQLRQGRTRETAHSFLEKLIPRFKSSFAFSEAEEDNFAVFLLLQKMLCKKGDGFFGHRGDPEVLASLLFLHVYRVPTPWHFTRAEYLAGDALLALRLGKAKPSGTSFVAKMSKRAQPLCGGGC